MPARRTGRKTPPDPLPTWGALVARRPAPKPARARTIRRHFCGHLVVLLAVSPERNLRRNRVTDYSTNLVATRGTRSPVPQSGNLVSVSCSDSSQSAAAVFARLAGQLRQVGWVRP